MPLQSNRPLISVVIVSYNMAREVPRTVQSFLPPYQDGIDSSEIEIIVLENGSSDPVCPTVIESWSQNVKYINVEDPHPSPAKALNVGVDMAKGEWVCPVIDGARMVTGGLFNSAKAMMLALKNPVIATIGYHLGSIVQQKNRVLGYDQLVEDQLLDSINWPTDPYRLFEISCAGGSAEGGWLGIVAESNVLILKKEFYEVLGGYDEEFDIPGGGLVNLDFFKRSIEHPDSDYVMLLGEGSFHQYHGGVTTSRSVSEPSLQDKNRTTWDIYNEQHLNIRGHTYSPSQIEPIIYGQLNRYAREGIIKSALFVHENNQRG